jgi:hypothetical protein
MKANAVCIFHSAALMFYIQQNIIQLCDLPHKISGTNLCYSSVAARTEVRAIAILALLMTEN